MNFRFFVALGFVVALSVRCTASELALNERETVDEDLSPNVGSVVPGSILAERAVWDRYDREVGKVEDLIIDPYYGRVTSFVIKPSDEVKRDRQLLVPFELVTPIKSKHLRASVTMKKIEDTATAITRNGSTPYTRTLSRATIRHYDLKPYWKEDERSATEGQDRLVMLSNLRDMVVKTPDDEPLGSIEDVVVSKKDGKIVYALLRHDHRNNRSTQHKKFPIPLAAFVVPPRSDHWTLELPERVLDGTEVTKGAAYPKEVSRGWVEYIHVRYGTGIFSGVQREAKTASN